MEQNYIHSAKLMPAMQDEVSKHIPSLCPDSKFKYLRFKEKSQSFLITVKVNLARKIVSALQFPKL